MRLHKLAAAALLGVAALGVSACATGIPAQVTRYSALPVPQGQSFFVVPANGVQSGLEFQRYAAIVSQHLAAKGYREAATTAAADMLVKVNYTVSEGVTEVREDRMAGASMGDPFGYGDPFYSRSYGQPYYSRYGYYGRYRDPFYYGWGDPFYSRYGSRYGGYSPYGRYGSRFGYGGYGSRYGYGGYGNRYGSGGQSGYDGYSQGMPVREYTVYESELDLDIVRRVDNAPLFDGKAVARSGTDELGVLVPNLIEAMFTNFPGRNGETVRITVPVRKQS
jgi:hypothetical protein